jgi:pantetheine-phosphate adenylyltransferase/dephospho-CoA kinase
MSKAIYAFSGDPITFGHIDIIQRAAELFDQLVVAIGVNPQKKYLFTLEERTGLAKIALANFPNVKVVSFAGLLIDFAYEIGADVIVRGVRNSSDFEFENSLFKMCQSQDTTVESAILISKPELAHVSSSNVKQLQLEQGLIHEYVPLNVKQALEARMSRQYIVAVTGEIGAGKTYVTKKFMELAKTKNIKAYHLDLDSITHSILKDLPQPKYQQIRQSIVKEFGQKVKNKDGSINRKILGEIVFNDREKLKLLNEMMHQPLLVRIRRELYEKKGLIFCNAALIAEAGMSYLSNNNVCLVKTDKESQKKRLLERDLTENQIERRLQSQYTFAQKKSFLEKVIQRDNFGKIWEIDNSVKGSEADIKEKFAEMVRYFELD